MKWKENSTGEADEILPPYSICAINSLPLDVKRAIYASLAPDELVERFHLDLAPDNPQIEEILKLCADPGSPTAEISLYHQPGFIDPVMQGLITDTPNGPPHILFLAMNDPESPRFDVDRLPDGTPTELGTQMRNIDAEIQAMLAGLAPGQVRKGLQLFGPTMQEFERFASSLGHEMYFAQPLYYHTAVIFEHFGFNYAKGRRLMERIQTGFEPDGEFTAGLDGSTPFRMPAAVRSIRLRSWALHDGLLAEPFTDVTMYKQVGEIHDVNTCPGCEW